MDEAKILARTYQDRVSVYRYQHEVDLKTGESTEREVLVYDNEPCAFSQSKNDISTRDEIGSQKQQEAVLFTMPDIKILDNDKVIVNCDSGETVGGRASRTFVYPLSHGETKIKIEGMA